MLNQYNSWGNYPPAQAEIVHRIHWRTENFPHSTVSSWLPYGRGRSYGDVCLNDQAGILISSNLNKFIAFDSQTGILRCESGLLLKDILELVVPHGWFLPVTPGTKFVTVGGAVANDVHGKNHHSAGSFGCHVRSFELLRSDNTRLLCSAEQNHDWFAASIGGLGLTGLIIWVEIQLQAIANPFFICDKERFHKLTDYFTLNTLAEKSYAFSVAWIDCLATAKHFGRGIFMAANHALQLNHLPAQDLKLPSFVKPHLPIQHRFTAKILNSVYYHSQLITRNHQLLHYEPYLYPLDNTYYSKIPFLQFQCVVPPDVAESSIKELLTCIVQHQHEVPFLAVLKTFGEKRSPGLLAFTRPGVTLAVDFLFRGQTTLNLFTRLSHIVRLAQGAIYPAKDARMSSADFKASFPNYEQFKLYLDPKFSSNFWRRVGGHD